ncbi:MAG TPA: TetR/AcrR family transcriptional regulator [Streptosporangiaceae bacterium]|nr:TetR/AcrR family transcriptional regulator [Streptosporangiaceae bacterium]
MTADTPQPQSQRLPIGGTSVQNRIADAAIELFYSRGAYATTVRDITAACGLTPGALYNHFSSKEQLLFVLIRDVHLLADLDLVAAVTAAGPDPVARLAAAVRSLISHAAAPRKQARVANREYVTLTDARRREITALRRQLRSRFSEVLLAGSQDGTFVLPGGHGPTAAALTANVISTICANISEWTQENYPMTLSELQQTYVQMALRLAGATRPLQER